MSNTEKQNKKHITNCEVLRTIFKITLDKNTLNGNNSKIQSIEMSIRTLKEM